MPVFSIRAICEIRGSFCPDSCDSCDSWFNSARFLPARLTPPPLGIARLGIEDDLAGRQGGANLLIPRLLEERVVQVQLLELWQPAEHLRRLVGDVRAVEA